MATWLDMQFSRGNADIGEDYWYHVPTPAWYPNALYPEIVSGSYSVHTYITDGWLLPTDPNLAASGGEIDVVVTGHHIPWSPDWDAHEPECWTTNGPRDRLFLEAGVRFDHAWVEAYRAKYPRLDPGQDLLWCENNYSDGWALSVWLDQDVNGDPTPGFHTLYLWCWFAWGDVQEFVHTFAEADLFDGQTHVFRAEWRMSTVVGSFEKYRENWAYFDLEDLAPDGEFEVFFDGTSLWSSNVLQFAINGAAGWVGDAYRGDHGWVVEGEAAFTRAWSQLGKYNEVYVCPEAAAYGYIKAGSVPGWLDIANFNEVLLDSTLFNGRIPSVQMDLWTNNPAAAIQARLYDGDAEASVGESVVVTGATPTKVDFDVTLNTGQHPYRLQVTSETPGVALFAAGPGLIERPGGEYEEPPPPVEPDPPPTSTRPSWWKDYDGTLAFPPTCGTFQHMGQGSFLYYRWTGVSTIVDNREGPIAYAGDLHGDVDPNTAALIVWGTVPGATAYRVYVYNCTNYATGELFDAHLQNVNLGVGYFGQPAPNMGPTVLVQFVDVPASPPNWGGWPPASSFPDRAPDFEYIFSGDTDGTSWVMWP